MSRPVQNSVIENSLLDYNLVLQSSSLQFNLLEKLVRDVLLFLCVTKMSFELKMDFETQKYFWYGKNSYK